jgi:uncharacterized protein involved in exopolysaccharide biosynthesis
MIEETNMPSRTLSDYWRAAVARRWWILGPMFFCWLIIWGISWIIPAAYRSETLILVEQQKIPEQYVVPNVVIDLQGRLQSMTEQILSRTRLQDIVDQFNLYPSERRGKDTDAMVERMRQDIQIELVESQDKRELHAFRVYYSAPNPQLAQNVAGELTSLFIHENLQAQQEQSEMTTQFLGKQVEDSKRNLVQQETKIKEFKSRFLGQLPSETPTNVQILVGLQNRQQQLGEAIGHAEQEKLYIESLLTQYRSEQISSKKTGDMLSPDEARQQIAALEQQLVNAEARYTADHPDVVALRAKLTKERKLKEEIDAQYTATQKAEEAGLDESAAPEVRPNSPVIQLRSQLKSNRLRLQNLQKELREVHAQIGDYEHRLRSAPALEQQLADISRSYEQ